MMEQMVDEADSNVTGDIILNDDCLIHVFKYLPIRDRIRLQRVNKRWQAVSQASWSSFTTLDFSDKLWGGDAYEMINENSVAKVLAQCGKYLKRCKMRSEIDFPTSFDVNINFDVFKLCPNLKSIEFVVPNLTAEKMKCVANHCKYIEEICFDDEDYYYPKVEIDHIIGTITFGAYKNLRVVRFHLCSITGTCLRNLSTDHLDELDFIFCDELVESEINYVISEYPYLKKLVLCECPNIDYSVIRYPKHLQILDVSNIETCINDDFLNCLTKTCRSLIGLNIACINTKVTDIGIAYIASLPNLKYLCVNGIPLITGRHFQEMTHLKILSCRDCDSIAEDYLEVLLEVADQLESLDLSGCELVTANFVISAVNILNTRKNDIILKITLLHIDQYAVKLPPNLKIEFKNRHGSYCPHYIRFTFPN